MPKQFAAALCVFGDGRPASPTSEHVWPLWLLRWLFPVAVGPFTEHVNGVAQLKSDGMTVRTESSVTRVKIPCCTVCNGILAKQFEVPAKQLVRRMIEYANETTFTGVEAATLGQWWVKTLLLLAHPAAMHCTPGPSPTPWASPPAELYSWMTSGQDPPDGISVWLTRPNRDQPSPDRRHIFLPTIVADGERIEFRSKVAGIRDFDLHLVFHPHWDIDVGLATRQALRLWPAADQPLDLAELDATPAGLLSWAPGSWVELTPGVLGHVDLPPLSPGVHPTMVLDSDVLLAAGV